jgi:hypothetical protein
VVRAHSGVSDTPIVKIEHPSNDADFAISGLYDSDGNVTYLGSNLYYNSSYAPARFDTGKPSSAITLSGRTGNGEITFLTGTATASERARIDSSGRLLVGTTTARSNVDTPGGNSTPFVQIETAAGSYSNGLSIINNSVGTFAPIVTLGATNGSSVGSNVIVSNGQYFGTINFVGADGTSLIEGASIRGEVDGTPGANDMPGRLVFSTTADGASSPTERARITAAGALKAASGGAAYIGTGSGYDAVHELVTNNNGYEALIVTNRNSSSPLGVQIFYATDVNNTANLFLGCYGSSNLRAGFRSNGGLANYQANNVNLSDRNAKKDISPAAGTWDCIKEWEIVNYRYKDQSNDADLNLGVIAQQVAESCPEVITVFQEAQDAKPAVLDDEGNEVEAAQAARPERIGVKEQQMYWMAIKALQEAQVRIETLEAKVAALESPTTALEIPVDPSSTDI